MIRRALLVTPDRAELNLCATALGMRGFDVARAESTSFARSLLSAHRPGVVVVEYPYELDGGFELLELLQESRRKGAVKVLVITGLRIPPDLEHVVREQSDVTLPAPVGPAVIAIEAARLAGAVDPIDL